MLQPILSRAWLLLLVGVACYIFNRARKSRIVQPSQLASSVTKNADYSEKSYYDIEPLTNFDLSTTSPIKLRPFKPKYHLTMALENITISELVAMDNTYTSRIALRRELISTRPNDVLALNEAAERSVLEFYDWIMGTYLPRRFPTVFALHPSSTSLTNLVTAEEMPLKPDSARQALQIIGGNVDDDFLFLLPTADEGKYRLEGFITCFPSGFKLAAKLGLKLADIHIPVPGYQKRLEKSMDRFFAALPVGKIVRRANWSVTTHGDLFCLSGNHTSEEEAEKLGERNQVNEWNIANAVLRCERQTLHRLPGTKALVFAFKTYQYGLEQVKEEGSGEDLAEAIDGLDQGNVPGMGVYKSAVLWGERVKSFLRGE